MQSFYIIASKDDSFVSSRAYRSEAEAVEEAKKMFGKMYVKKVTVYEPGDNNCTPLDAADQM